MDVRFISERENGIYAYVEYPNGKKYDVDYTYLKNVANVKKAINVEYELMDCHIVITKCDGLYETAICEKSFVAGKRKNWKTIKPAEEVESQPAEEVENQPAEEVESRPAEEVESQPAKKTDKIKGRYLAIEMKIKNSQGEMIDRFYLFDVSRETNKVNIMKFADSFISNSIAVAYIVEEYIRNVSIIGKKVYNSDSRTYWIRKNDVLSKTFLDDFRK